VARADLRQRVGVPGQAAERLGRAGPLVLQLDLELQHLERVVDGDRDRAGQPDLVAGQQLLDGHDGGRRAGRPDVDDRAAVERARGVDLDGLVARRGDPHPCR
jgi:hypothetical protein